MDLSVVAVVLIVGAGLAAAGLAAWRGRGLARLYWLACLGLLGFGVAAMLLVMLVPVELPDADGGISGEMPKAFGVALLLAVTGLAGIVLGLAAALFRRLRR
ncbi:MAG: hypothetical protein J0H82_03800 [Alphaproteobacteria bacterium]|jgi:hypothetical protein|nr:hypothetical protein [Alphaproteobacteria bacterium]